MNSDIGTAVRILNEAFAADPAALHSLVCNRVPANAALVDHPSVVCEESRPITSGDRPAYNVGLLGVLNGVLEPITGERVAVAFSEPRFPGDLVKMLGFRVWRPTAEDQS